MSEFRWAVFRLLVADTFFCYISYFFYIEFLTIFLKVSATSKCSHIFHVKSYYQRFVGILHIFVRLLRSFFAQKPFHPSQQRLKLNNGDKRKQLIGCLITSVTSLVLMLIFPITYQIERQLYHDLSFLHQMLILLRIV